MTQLAGVKNNNNNKINRSFDSLLFLFDKSINTVQMFNVQRNGGLLLKLLPEISFESSNIQIVMLVLLEAFSNSVHSLLNNMKTGLTTHHCPLPNVSIVKYKMDIKCMFCLSPGYQPIPIPILTHIPLLN